MRKTEGIYVCVFTTGTVKVGRGSCVEARIANHRAMGKCFGVNMLTHMTFPCGNTVPAERELIQWCADNSDSVVSREWFVGVNVAACQQAATEIAAKYQAKAASIYPILFEKVTSHFRAKAGDYSREEAAYLEARKMVSASGALTPESFVSMDALHRLCELIRSASNTPGVVVPEWFETLNCMQSWEIDLLMCEGCPDVALVEDINAALDCIKAEKASAA